MTTDTDSGQQDYMVGDPVKITERPHLDGKVTDVLSETLVEVVFPAISSAPFKINTERLELAP